ncbi:hypothetical protein EMCRGX_G035065 [Ephydatia muelleri]
MYLEQAAQCINTYRPSCSVPRSLKCPLHIASYTLRIESSSSGNENVSRSGLFVVSCEAMTLTRKVMAW